MCVVSNIGDHYARRWPQAYPWLVPQPPTTTSGTTVPDYVTREEFAQLLAEVMEMKELLKAAKRIDEVTGQPDCEMEDKVALLRRVAEIFGVDLDDVFPQT